MAAVASRGRLTGRQTVARHCTKFKLNDTKDQVLADAFEPTPEKRDVSVNWLEYYRGARNQRIAAVCRDIRTGRTLKQREHRLALLKTSAIDQISRETNIPVEAHHTPMDNSASHSDLQGIPLVSAAARILYQKLADVASKDIVQPTPE